MMDHRHEARRTQMAAAPDEPTRPQGGSGGQGAAPSQDVPTPGNQDGPSPESQLATSVVAYLLAGPLTFGGIGFGLDRLIGTWIFLPLGVIVGMALSIYVIWLRYGTP